MIPRLRLLLAFAAALALALATEARADAEPLRLLVAVGHRAGGPRERPLRHAHKDAARVRDVLVRQGGVAPEHAELLLDPSPDALRAALARASRAARARPAGDVTLFFYFSGHGDRERLHLGGQEVPVAELETWLRQVPAALRVAVTDACRTEDARAKGLGVEPGFAVTLGETAQATGLAWLHASADGEAAQESDVLEGALFTYFWTTGLAGAADADGDGRVTLAESWTYGHDQTLYRSSRASGAVQRPRATFDLREAAPVVVTRTLPGTTALAFPRARDTQYLVFSHGTHAPFGEVWARPEREIALALPPGRWIVHRHARGGTGAVEVVLRAGERRAISASDFRDVPEERLAEKGGEVDVRPWEIGLEGGLVGSDPSTAGGLGGRGGVVFARRFGPFALAAAASVGSQRDAGAVHLARTTSLGLDARAELRMPFGDFALRLAGGATARALFQELERADAVDVAPGGYATREAHRAFALGPAAAIALRLHLGELAYAELGGAGAIPFARVGDALSPIPEAAALVGIGTRF